MTVPNLITVLRFLLVPAIIYFLLTGALGWALAAFLLAGISDGIDGVIARQFNQRSEVGAYLDPIADKTMLVSVFLILGYLGELPLWLVIISVSRDVLIVGGVMLASIMGNPLEMKPLFISKANTTAQIALVAFVLVELALAIEYPLIRTGLILIAAVLTVASAGAYLVTWMRHTGE